jgi:hypothetical protein
MNQRLFLFVAVFLSTCLGSLPNPFVHPSYAPEFHTSSSNNFGSSFATSNYVYVTLSTRIDRYNFTADRTALISPPRQLISSSK